MKYYIEERNPSEGKFIAISKARNDAADIVKSLGFKPVVVETGPKKGDVGGLREKLNNLAYIRKNYIKWDEALKCTRPGDTVFIQYPALYWTMMGRVVENLKKKGVKTVALVHDMESLRWEANKRFIKKYSYYEDILGLKRFDKIITHNIFMKRKMIAMGFNPKKLISLGIFDYLWDYKEGVKKDYTKELPLVIAGNLFEEKAEYLYRFRKPFPVKLNLYGPNLNEDFLENIDYSYKGAVGPRDLPGKISGSFGLVWDGVDTETCRGEYGEYLTINNPHKMSLYMAAGIPVIIWSNAALAGVVKKYELGFTVESLYEIPDKINTLSDKQYDIYKRNVEVFAGRVRDGYFLKKALKKAGVS